VTNTWSRNSRLHGRRRGRGGMGRGLCRLFLTKGKTPSRITDAEANENPPPPSQLGQHQLLA
jgi:hypothetical protein